MALTYKITVLCLLCLLIWTPFRGARFATYELSDSHGPIQAIDGDTLRAWVPQLGGWKFLRLSYIDAPELAQRSQEGIKVGELAKNCLEDLLKTQRKFIIQHLSTDIYKRPIVVLTANQNERPLDIGLELVKKGMSFLYGQKSQAPRAYRLALSEARAKKRGLFSTRGVQSPYLFRRKQRGKTLMSLGKNSPLRYSKIKKKNKNQANDSKIFKKQRPYFFGLVLH